MVLEKIEKYGSIVFVISVVVFILQAVIFFFVTQAINFLGMLFLEGISASLIIFVFIFLYEEDLEGAEKAIGVIAIIIIALSLLASSVFLSGPTIEVTVEDVEFSNCRYSIRSIESELGPLGNLEGQTFLTCGKVNGDLGIVAYYSFYRVNEDGSSTPITAYSDKEREICIYDNENITDGFVEEKILVRKTKIDTNSLWVFKIFIKEDSVTSQEIKRKLCIHVPPNTLKEEYDLNL